MRRRLLQDSLVKLLRQAGRIQVAHEMQSARAWLSSARRCDDRGLVESLVESRAANHAAALARLAFLVRLGAPLHTSNVIHTHAATRSPCAMCKASRPVAVTRSQPCPWLQAIFSLQQHAMADERGLGDEIIRSASRCWLLPSALSVSIGMHVPCLAVNHTSPLRRRLAHVHNTWLPFTTWWFWTRHVVTVFSSE